MGDRCHDGQAEAGAWAGAGPAAEAAERLEQPGYLVGGNVLAAVGDGELGGARLGPGAGQDPAASHVVLDGVVDEVAGQPFDQQPVPGDLGVLQRGVDPDLPGRGG